MDHRRWPPASYRQGLEGTPGPRLPHFSQDDRTDVFQNYVVRTKQRDELREYIRVQGVETLVHWPKPLWHHRDLGLENPQLVETERICREVLSLPMSAETTEEHVDIT